MLLSVDDTYALSGMGRQARKSIGREGGREEQGRGQGRGRRDHKYITYDHSSALVYVAKIDYMGNPRTVGHIVLLKAD